MRKVGFWIFAALIGCLAPAMGRTQANDCITLAVEFTDHAASAFIAMEHHLYEAQGLCVNAYESYATGTALSSALTQGQIHAAYMCLVPAINAYANGGVPIKVVSGTHLYGYGLVVNPDKIKTVRDLQSQEARIGCMQEGSAVDMLLHKTMEKFNLDKKKVLARTRRMSPEKALLAIQAQQLDAAFMPEHWASMAQLFGFEMLLSAKEIWPGMPGSVLVVRTDLINRQPQTVDKLVRATIIATQWLNHHPEQRARITARYLSLESDKTILKDFIADKTMLSIDAQLMARSMQKLEYSATLDSKAIQQVIDDMARLGYIKKVFAAGDILDSRFLDMVEQ